MKKILFAFAMASIFAACNDSKTDSTTVTDSTQVNNSVTVPPVTNTTVIKVDSSSNKMSADTSHK